jgi:hypothetical protein
MASSHVHVVVARHREDLTWLFETLRERPTWTASVFNDGTPVALPKEVEARIKVAPGDGIPQEGTKYLRYILDNWHRPHPGHVVFLQGDPEEHNPTIRALLRHSDEWDEHYQNLGLYVNDAWEYTPAILDGSMPNVARLGAGGLTWHDELLDDLSGRHAPKDVAWLHSVLARHRISTDGLLQRLASSFGMALPEDPTRRPKAYAALFAVSWKRLNTYPSKFWRKLLMFLIRGDAETASMTPKERAVLLEYMWGTILSSTPVAGNRHDEL